MKYPDSGGLSFEARAQREAVRFQAAEMFAAGPGGHGWVEDRRWTLARVAALIVALVRVRDIPRGVSYPLHRIGWTPQVPAHRAVERDEEAVTTWVKETWLSGWTPPWSGPA
ncbi:helix-turn-helix domain-containing protein [Pseudonocardia asaccharolytica]|uniref:Winged helix-turn helix domain-containing protein n=1 Tax=Pseudonocardia asaccharolytica DSM 44247 = NBRC 16224 TaxID=1123024 RepID=A0A511D9D7_9PSEU|nr:winged helix-turn-helix domain-containing protein [Pseudonocardia asaccharolytica]GEL20254.1 hypothetical protein PA7_40910 [Pseudonocardia asaccharolytica DSM 44247 = NBRC 16224]